jgi:type II secretory pathway pseudopilin PulG
MLVTSWFRPRRSSDEGFTLVELTVAMVVTLLVATSLVTVFLSSISGVALAKQRQAATGLATAVMEKFRALDYGTLSAGLYCSDLSGDANLSVSGSCGGGGVVTFAPAGTSINETVQVQSTAAPASSVPPIFPHSVSGASTTVDGVQYTVKSYVTRAATTASSFNLTVLVSWSSTVTHGATKTVTQRSLEFSPSRCLSSSTHPYSGACQASFNGDAGLTNAGITITAVGDTTVDIPGLNASSIELALPALSASLGVEQISKLTGLAGTSSVSVVSSTGTTSSGGAATSVAADSDPSSSSGGVATGTVSQSSSSTLTVSGTAGSLTAAPTTGDAGSADSRVTSTSSSCQDATGSNLPATGRPCSWGNVQQAGTTGALALQLSYGAPNFTLATVGAAPTPARASTAALASAGASACTTTTGAGCVTAQSARSLGTVRLGGLPSATGGGDVLPSGWPGYLVRVDGVRERAQAEAGIGALAPSFTRSAGAVSYYDVSDHTTKTLDLTTLTATTEVDLGTVEAQYTWGGHAVSIDITASFRAGQATNVASASADDPACKTAACTATATAPSTLIATLIYDVTVDGATATQFAMIADLGACVSRASYTAAFDA